MPGVDDTAKPRPGPSNMSTPESKTSNRTDLTLPGIKDSPVENFRVLASGVLVRDQAVQTKPSSTVELKRGSRVHTHILTRSRTQDPGTAAIARWAKL